VALGEIDCQEMTMKTTSGGEALGEKNPGIELHVVQQTGGRNKKRRTELESRKKRGDRH